MYYYRKRNAPAATTATDAPINPATGYPEGSPEDLAAMAQLSAAAPQYTPGPVAAGAGSNYTYPSPQFASNAAWEQAALDYIVNQAGGDEHTVSQALGAYLAGQEVNASQESIINEATGSQGLPPVAGANGYPPSIKRVAVSPPGPTPTSPKALTTPQLFVTSKTRTSASLKWTAVEHAAFYLILGSRFPIFVTGTSRAVPIPGAYHIRAYPSNYSRTTYELVDASNPYRLSAGSNSVRV